MSMTKHIFHFQAMYDTFSAFGNILSCKVAQDMSNGESKGYGFVHFETEEAALNAIQKVNGMLLNGKKVYVGRFVPRKDRDMELGEKARKFTNVYVKNINDEYDEAKLNEMFQKYGKISSVKVKTTVHVISWVLVKDRVLVIFVGCK